MKHLLFMESRNAIELLCKARGAEKMMMCMFVMAKFVCCFGISVKITIRKMNVFK